MEVRNLLDGNELDGNRWNGCSVTVEEIECSEIRGKRKNGIERVK